jgi:hypothetical protein
VVLPVVQTDFRETFKGTFNVVRKKTQQQHPSGGPASVWDTTTNEILTVSYKIADSIVYYSNSPSPSKRPAMMFRYNFDSMLVGVDASGKLYKDPQNPNSTNYGGFIGPDSIFHAWRELSTSVTYLDTLSGRRK